LDSRFCGNDIFVSIRGYSWLISFGLVLLWLLNLISRATFLLSLLFPYLCLLSNSTAAIRSAGDLPSQYSRFSFISENSPKRFLATVFLIIQHIISYYTLLEKKFSVFFQPDRNGDGFILIKALSQKDHLSSGFQLKFPAKEV